MALGLALAASAVAGCAKVTTGSTVRPNVIIILADDQGWPHYRGPEYSGSAQGPSDLSRDELALAVTWKRAEAV